MSLGLCAACGVPHDPLPAQCPTCGREAWLDGRYELLEVLGHGASATVYRARRREDGLEVAVRELLFVGRAGPDVMRTHVLAFANLKSPGIPAILEHLEVSGPSGAVDYVVQELIEGETLAAEQTHRRYTEAEVFALLAELLEIAADLHEQDPPLVHRDIKPENVVRRPDGRLALVDLGSVAVARATPPDARFTATGTVGYMPTEQIAGEVRPESDIYALGALALALLTRSHPAQLLDESLELRWESRVQLGVKRVRLLREMLRRDAEARPSDARALALRARRLVADGGPKGRVRVAPSLALGALAIAGAAVGLGFVLGGSAPSISKSPPPPEPVASGRVASAPAAPPQPFSPLVPPDYEWQCQPDRTDTRTRLQIVVPARACAAGEPCEAVESGFGGLDLSALCDLSEQTHGRGIVERSERSFEHVLYGETVRCRVQDSAFGCHVTCLHPDSRTHDALTERYERILASTREVVGPETSANVQGLRWVPRADHRWRSGNYQLGVELDRDLCCEPSAASCHASLRTRYSRMGPAPAG